MSHTPEFEVTITLRNNKIKRRRLELGLTQKALAAAAGVNSCAYWGMENLRFNPFQKNGDWKKPVLALAEFFHVQTPWELFPKNVAELVEKQHIAVKELDAHQITYLLHAEDTALPTPEESVQKKQLQQVVRSQMMTLTPRKERILRQYYGIGSEKHTLKEIGAKEGVSTERIRMIVAQAKKDMRHPSRAQHLHTVTGG
jgi:RNA polymerase sigma factor (sigma-70 family)